MNSISERLNAKSEKKSVVRAEFTFDGSPRVVELAGSEVGHRYEHDKVTIFANSKEENKTVVIRNVDSIIITVSN